MGEVFMKMLATLFAVLGFLGFVLAVLYVLLHFNLYGLTGAGFLRGSSVLFLMALVIMVYDRFYLQKK
jgi:hypothetical protein